VQRLLITKLSKHIILMVRGYAVSYISFDQYRN